MLRDNFNLVAFRVDDNTFVIAVAGRACTTYNDDAVLVKFFHHVVHVFSVADANCEMMITCAITNFFGVCGTCARHDFESRTVSETQKVIAEVVAEVGVFGTRLCVEILDEEIFLRLQVINVHGNMVDSHDVASVLQLPKLPARISISLPSGSVTMLA